MFADENRRNSVRDFPFRRIERQASFSRVGVVEYRPRPDYDLGSNGKSRGDSRANVSLSRPRVRDAMENE